MSQHSRTLAVLAFGVMVAVSGLALTRQVIAVAGEADAGRLSRAILEYVAQKNPYAPIAAFRGFPETLLIEAQRSNLDHCLALAQAEVESSFRHDVVGGAGAAGEIGLFQILPTTAAIFEPQLGPFRRPQLGRARRDLGDLADPVVSTRFAMAYLRDIMIRKPSVREALTEYNGGPGGRHPHYYRMVMGAYFEVLEYAPLRCRFREAPRPTPQLTFLTRA
jgi:soluble lytic murein transglycosylase-like protein